jgi:hypothetical protein
MSRIRHIRKMGLIVAVGLILPGWGYALDESEGPDPAIRRETLARLEQRLRSADFPGSDAPVPVELIEGDINRGAIYRLPDEGVIETGDGSWIRIVTVSDHKQPRVGNVILAQDNQSRLFFNPAHVCGTETHFVAVASRPAADADDFFARFIPDIGEESWEPYPQPEPAGAP